MDLRVFQAATMHEALAQVKQMMGHDAVILHTRTFCRRAWLGLRRKEVVEITAGKGLNVGARTPRRAAARREATGIAAYQRQAGAPMALASQAERLETGRQQLLQTPAASNAIMLGISKEMESLKATVATLASEIRNHRASRVPEEMAEFFCELIESQVDEDLAAEIVKTVFKNVRPEHLAHPDFVREKIVEQIEKLLPTSGPIRRIRTNGPHVVALIGPTGVGKTTTIAKLAANLMLRERHRVGLITIDTYRIAAIDQLKRYADIIGAPLKVVASPSEVRAAIDAMSDCEFVLIDTAGRSPNDTLKLNELKAFLAAAAVDETHLVLSSTASQDCVELAMSRFGDVGHGKIIFTKLDEAANLGVVLNVVRKTGKLLSYVTNGQDVPDDIEVGCGRKLARRVIKERSVTV
jgi:flagellar biosynthesis protein FlhF